MVQRVTSEGGGVAVSESGQGGPSATAPAPGRSPAPPRTSREAATKVIVAVRPSLWAELLAGALAVLPDLAVVARVDDENLLLQAAAMAESPVVLLDYEAWGPGTEAIVARIRRENPKTRVLVLARRAGDDVVVGVLRAGATGLVGKDRDLATVVAAIRAVAGGEAWANRIATARALSQLADPDRSAHGRHSLLTRRERDILDRVCDGLRNREIAAALGISEKTVKTHLGSLFSKARVGSRMALARWAQQAESPGGD